MPHVLRRVDFHIKSHTKLFHCFDEVSTDGKLFDKNLLTLISIEKPLICFEIFEAIRISLTGSRFCIATVDQDLNILR